MVRGGGGGGLEHYRLLEASRSGGGTALLSGVAYAWSHGLDHGILYHLFLFAFLGLLLLFVVSDGQKFLSSKQSISLK